MATNDSLEAHDMFVDIQRAARCGKGWDRRCPKAKGKRCTCQCGGANHGAIYQAQVLGDAMRMAASVSAGGVHEEDRP